MSHDPLDIHQAGPFAKRLAIARDAIWIFLGVACISSCLQFYADPAAVKRTVIGRKLGSHVDDLWSVAYGTAGVLILYGVLRRHGRAEIVGQLFFMAGLIPNMVAIIITVGGGPSFWVIFAAFWASVGRVYFLWHTTPRKR